MDLFPSTSLNKYVSLGKTFNPFGSRQIVECSLSLSFGALKKCTKSFCCMEIVMRLWEKFRKNLHHKIGIWIMFKMLWMLVNLFVEKRLRFWYAIWCVCIIQTIQIYGFELMGSLLVFIYINQIKIWWRKCGKQNNEWGLFFVPFFLSFHFFLALIWSTLVIPLRFEYCERTFKFSTNQQTLSVIGVLCVRVHSFARSFDWWLRNLHRPSAKRWVYLSYTLGENVHKQLHPDTLSRSLAQKGWFFSAHSLAHSDFVHVFYVSTSIYATHYIEKRERKTQW